ncbi:MAG: acyl-CoA/acyl-ACP dehydrogenase [Gammaproteobacteria bacterium]|nr:acyl-CoA/acyl-ACP dehydrogenase [Gammaproteobacteria bacterium]MBQ0839822.1 acyl-CoA/acyl-ACP dehydrogenase [Gammaproteobacteria bacterium]
MTQAKNFAFGEDEKLLRDTARKFLQDNLPTDKLHQLVASDPDPYRESLSLWDKNLWQQIVELGWTTVIVPEADGGMGMSLVALCALVEETGRVSLPSPFIATSCASLVLRECHSPAAGHWLGEIAGGSTATLACTPKNGSWLAADCDVELVDGKLSGSAWFVQDARKVDNLIVQAKTSKGTALYKVSTHCEGLNIVADAIIDLTRDQAHIHFNNVPVGDAQRLSDDARAVLERAEPGLLTLVAADMCGAGEWQLQTTVEYMKVREQFGHPLGYFQALKHPLVNLMIMIDQAKSLTYNAASAIDSEPQNAAKFARMAKASASEMAAFASNRSIQFHGGIGFTWECFVHLYCKRQKHNQVLYGDAKYQRAKLAEILMGPISA